jgi:hypothetical protein
MQTNGQSHHSSSDARHTCRNYTLTKGARESSVIKILFFFATVATGMAAVDGR